MKDLAAFIAAACVCASPGNAFPIERIECRLSATCQGLQGCAAGTVQLRFAIDMAQFSPAVGAGDPPRRKTTRVETADQAFAAEPIVMSDGLRGFWAEADGVDHLLTIKPDGTAAYTRIPGGKLTGRCSVRQ